MVHSLFFFLSSSLLLFSNTTWTTCTATFAQTLPEQKVWTSAFALFPRTNKQFTGDDNSQRLEVFSSERIRNNSFCFPRQQTESHKNTTQPLHILHFHECAVKIALHRFENIGALKNDEFKNPAKFLLRTKWKQSRSFTSNGTKR